MTEFSGIFGTGMGPVTPGMIGALRATRPWVRFLSVLGFVAAGFMVVAALSVFVVGTFMPADEGAGGGLLAVLAIVYLIGAVVYTIAARHLWRYASSLAQAIRQPVDLRAMEAALAHQSSFWKFTGIAAIATLVLYIPAMILFTVFAQFAGPDTASAGQYSTGAATQASLSRTDSSASASASRSSSPLARLFGSDSEREQRTADDMAALSQAIDAYAMDTNYYPSSDSIHELAGLLEPMYMRNVPRADAWGEALSYEPLNRDGRGRAAGYALLSAGSNRKVEVRRFPTDRERSGPTVGDDLVLINGQWWQLSETVTVTRPRVQPAYQWMQ